MSNATVLQTAANRFSKVAGFSPIIVDGNIGANTLNAARAALSYLKNSFDVSDSIVDDAAAWLSTARDAQSLGANAAAIGQFLSQAADEAGLPHIAGPIVSSGGGGGGASTPLPITLPIVSSSGGAANILDAFKALPTWQKILIGALAGVGMIWLWGRYKKSRGLSGLGTTKLYLFTYKNRHNTWSDVWARDVDDARDKIRAKKNASGFYSISRVTNVPPRLVA